MVHCGVLTSGHTELSLKIANLDIVSAKEISSTFNFSQYKYVFIDESHRFYKSQFEIVVKKTIEQNLWTVFSYDKNQTLSKAERKADIATAISKLPNYSEFKLSNKVRSNPEIASFIRKLMNLHAGESFECYPSVDIRYARDEEEAKLFINEFKRLKYTFINYTSSRYCRCSHDVYRSLYNTHYVIGQEFDNVLMVMDNIFNYNSEGKLVGKEHPNPDYIYRQLLFQGLTRVREKLAIVVVRNDELFSNILTILN
ncbi:hypothetical protein J2Z34_002801 [Youngiibacter multivorans]|uniref:DUF2075 domain-containing protein n=1 Tax=Youngiibacter multivorans TaxID=937251 RepID=A0ABS4G6T9_9CLOT|nr:hypothetical protein [Youngiibacter multivorans]